MVLIYQVTDDLLKVLNILDVYNGVEVSYNIRNVERLKQYLRKFRFFYQYYYLKCYPNNLSTLSIKKINCIAIKSLFVLNSF